MDKDINDLHLNRSMLDYLRGEREKNKAAEAEGRRRDTPEKKAELESTIASLEGTIASAERKLLRKKQSFLFRLFHR